MGQQSVSVSKEMKSNISVWRLAAQILICRLIVDAIVINNKRVINDLYQCQKKMKSNISEWWLVAKILISSLIFEATVKNNEHVIRTACYHWFLSVSKENEN